MNGSRILLASLLMALPLGPLLSCTKVQDAIAPLGFGANDPLAPLAGELQLLHDDLAVSWGAVRTQVEEALKPALSGTFEVGGAAQMEPYITALQAEVPAAIDDLTYQARKKVERGQAIRTEARRTYSRAERSPIISEEEVADMDGSAARIEAVCAELTAMGEQIAVNGDEWRKRTAAALAVVQGAENPPPGDGE